MGQPLYNSLYNNTEGAIKPKNNTYYPYFIIELLTGTGTGTKLYATTRRSDEPRVNGDGTVNGRPDFFGSLKHQRYADQANTGEISLTFVPHGSRDANWLETEIKNAQGHFKFKYGYSPEKVDCSREYRGRIYDYTSSMNGGSITYNLKFVSMATTQNFTVIPIRLRTIDIRKNLESFAKMSWESSLQDNTGITFGDKFIPSYLVGVDSSSTSYQEGFSFLSNLSNILVEPYATNGLIVDPFHAVYGDPIRQSSNDVIKYNRSVSTLVIFGLMNQIVFEYLQDCYIFDLDESMATCREFSVPISRYIIKADREDQTMSPISLLMKIAETLVDKEDPDHYSYKIVVDDEYVLGGKSRIYLKRVGQVRKLGTRVDYDFIYNGRDSNVLSWSPKYQGAAVIFGIEGAPEEVVDETSPTSENQESSTSKENTTTVASETSSMTSITRKVNEVGSYNYSTVTVQVPNANLKKAYPSNDFILMSNDQFVSLHTDYKTLANQINYPYEGNLIIMGIPDNDYHPLKLLETNIQIRQGFVNASHHISDGIYVVKSIIDTIDSSGFKTDLGVFRYANGDESVSALSEKVVYVFNQENGKYEEKTLGQYLKQSDYEDYVQEYQDSLIFNREARLYFKTTINKDRTKANLEIYLDKISYLGELNFKIDYPRAQISGGYDISYENYVSTQFVLYEGIPGGGTAERLKSPFQVVDYKFYALQKYETITCNWNIGPIGVTESAARDVDINGTSMKLIKLGELVFDIKNAYPQDYNLTVKGISVLNIDGSYNYIVRSPENPKFSLSSDTVLSFDGYRGPVDVRYVKESLSSLSLNKDRVWYSFDSATWYRYDSGSLVELSPDESFDFDEYHPDAYKYVLRLRISTLNDYKLTDSVSVFINGQDGSYLINSVSVFGDHESCEIETDPITSEELRDIESVAISGYKLPQIGDLVKDNISSITYEEEEKFESVVFSWYDETIDDFCDLSDHFQSGHEYQLRCFFDSSYYYEFIQDQGQDVSITVNGDSSAVASSEKETFFLAFRIRSVQL